MDETGETNPRRGDRQGADLGGEMWASCLCALLILMALRGFWVKSTECVSMINFHLMKYFHFNLPLLLHLHLLLLPAQSQSIPSALFPFCTIYRASQLALCPPPSACLPSPPPCCCWPSWGHGRGVRGLGSLWIFPLSRFTLISYRAILVPGQDL